MLNFIDTIPREFATNLFVFIIFLVLVKEKFSSLNFLFLFYFIQFTYGFSERINEDTGPSNVSQSGTVNITQFFENTILSGIQDLRLWIYTTNIYGVIVTFGYKDESIFANIGAIQIGSEGISTMMILERSLYLESESILSIISTNSSLFMSSGASIFLSGNLQISGTLLINSPESITGESESSQIYVNNGILKGFSLSNEPPLFNDITVTFENQGFGILDSFVSLSKAQLNVLSNSNLDVIYGGIGIFVDEFNSTNNSKDKSNVSSLVYVENSQILFRPPSLMELELVKKSNSSISNNTFQIFLDTWVGTSSIVIISEGEIDWFAQLNVMETSSQISVVNSSILSLYTNSTMNGLITIDNTGYFIVEGGCYLSGNGTIQVEGTSFISGSLDILLIQFTQKLIINGYSMTFGELHFYGATVKLNPPEPYFHQEIFSFNIFLNDGNVTQTTGYCVIAPNQLFVGSNPSYVITHATHSLCDSENKTLVGEINSFNIYLGNSGNIVVGSESTLNLVNSILLLQNAKSNLFLKQGSLIFVENGIFIESGNILVNNFAYIISNVTNSGGIISSSPFSDTKTLFTLTIEGSYIQEENGILIINRIGYANNTSNSLLLVDNAFISGIVQIDNEEGIQEYDSFPIIKSLNSNNQNFSVSNNTIVKTSYPEDYPMELIVNGDAIWATTLGSTMSAATFNILKEYHLTFFIFIWLL